MTDYKKNTEPVVQVTVITSDHGPINKTLDVAPDGGLLSDTDSCRVWSGTVETSAPVTPLGFADILWHMKNNQAAILGQLKPEFANDGKPVRVVTEKKLVSLKQTLKSTVARTINFFGFPAVPHMMVIDFDRKQMPAAIAARIEAAGGVVALLQEIFPELAFAGRVVRNSASSGLSVNGRPIEGGGGQHIFYLVADGSDIPRVIETMHKRLVNLGLGWIFISESGARLLRSPVDASVNKPNGLAFEGAPVLRGGLEQDIEARKPEVFDGEALDTKAAFPLLTAAEEKQFEITRDNLRRKAAKTANAKADTYDRNLAKTIAKKTKKAFETVLRQVKMRHRHRLPPEWPLEFDHLGQKTVADVTADPEAYVNETLADPIEGVAYGKNKAMVMLDKQSGLPFIHSFAHGGAHYELTLDEKTVAEAIGNTAPEAVLDVLEELLKRLMVEAGAIDRLKDQAGKRAGLGKAEVNVRLKSVLEGLKQEEAKAAQAAAQRAQEARQDRSDDDRVEVPAPNPAAPRGAVADLLDQLLAKVKADEPPMRDSEGRLLKIRDYALPDMHELRDDYEHDAVLESGEAPDRIAAPMEPRLHVRDADEIGVLIEQHVRLMKPVKGGGREETHLELPFCHALNKLEKRSAMPVARGITTMPVVKVDRRGRGILRMPVGLDRETGIIFRIPEELRAAMPRFMPTAEEARQAFQWLSNEWLADVATDAEGRMLLISMGMTIIQRHSFTERPDFILSGAAAGTGKTTAANMVSMAVLGHRAPAAAWSSSAEERRKSLFAIFRAGTALAVFDNLKRGTEIQDETCEKVQTSRRYSDRKLGEESEQEDGEATTVIAWTGNAIRAKGDSNSRNLLVNFETEFVRPAERLFWREQPVDWTFRYRAKILGDLFTLLLSDRQFAPGMVAPTRFKAWWRAIGRPLELAAGEGMMSFAEIMAEAETEDTEELAVAGLIGTLHGEFGQTPFRASAAAALFELNYWEGRGREHNSASTILDQLKHDLIEATGGTPPESWSGVAVGQRLKHIINRAVQLSGIGRARLTGKADRNGVIVWRIEVLEKEQTANEEPNK